MSIDYIAEELNGMTWNEYRKGCRMSNVEPVRADLAIGDIPSCVRYQIALQKPQSLAKAATT